MVRKSKSKTKSKLKSKAKKVSKRKSTRKNPIKLKKIKYPDMDGYGDGFECTECGASAYKIDKIPHKKGCPPNSRYLMEDDQKDIFGRSIDDRISKDFSGGQRPRLTNNYRRGW